MGSASLPAQPFSDFHGQKNIRRACQFGFGASSAALRGSDSRHAVLAHARRSEPSLLLLSVSEVDCTTFQKKAVQKSTKACASVPLRRQGLFAPKVMAVFLCLPVLEYRTREPVGEHVRLPEGEFIESLAPRSGHQVVFPGRG
jgi:hypothetical protein